MLSPNNCILWLHRIRNGNIVYDPHIQRENNAVESWTRRNSFLAWSFQCMNSFLQTPAGKAFAQGDPSHSHTGAHVLTNAHKALGKTRKPLDPACLYLFQATTYCRYWFALFPTTSKGYRGRHHGFWRLGVVDEKIRQTWEQAVPTRWSAWKGSWSIQRVPHNSASIVHLLSH